MTLQQQIYQKQALGVIGEFSDNSPIRVANYIARSNADVLPAIGCAYTLTDTENEVQIGGDGTFAGIAAGLKQYASESMESGLTLTDGAITQICSMGHIFITTKTYAKPGYIAAFDPDDGDIYAYETSDEATEAGHTVIANAKFLFHEAEADAIAILELNP